MRWFSTMIVGALIGSVASRITKKHSSMGCFTKMVAGLLGSSVGQALFSDMGPKLADMAVIPSILGAVIVIAVVSFFVDNKR